MDYDEFVDSTQDNTQVRQIMGDFQDFLRRQTTSGYSSMVEWLGSSFFLTVLPIG